MKTKTKFASVVFCKRVKFHNIDCLEMNDELGFEGYYNNDVNHPDPRPGHAIWIKKKDAEKLFMLFNEVKK
jgi:hypothetical protein